MRLSATLALRAAAVGVTLGAVAVPASLAHAAVPHGTSAGPAITVTPNTNVKDGSKVTVSGTGFPADQPTVYIVECSGTSGAGDCDLGNINMDGSTDGSGNFSGVQIAVHTGTVGGGTCDAGGTCYIAASTSASPTPDPSNSAAAPFTFAKSKTVATKTTAKFSHKHGAIVGKVKAAGKGVKGLKTKLEIRKHGKWKVLETMKTHKHGAYASSNLKSGGKYLVKTPKQLKYGASKSKSVIVTDDEARLT